MLGVVCLNLGIVAVLIIQGDGVLAVGTGGNRQRGGPWTERQPRHRNADRPHTPKHVHLIGLIDEVQHRGIRVHAAGHHLRQSGEEGRAIALDLVPAFAVDGGHATGLHKHRKLVWHDLQNRARLERGVWVLPCQNVRSVRAVVPHYVDEMKSHNRAPPQYLPILASSRQTVPPPPQGTKPLGGF